jgi:hypothetical protein
MCQQKDASFCSCMCAVMFYPALSAKADYFQFGFIIQDGS